MSAKAAGECSGHVLQVGQCARALLARRPARGQDVADGRPCATGLGQVAVAQHLLGQVAQRVGAALPGVAAVGQALPAGERLESGQDHLRLVDGQAEAADQRPVLRAAGRQVALGLRRPVVLVEGRLAVRGDQVRDPLPEAVRVAAGGDRDELRLHLLHVRERDPPDQPGQHRGLLLGELAVQDRVDDQRQVAQQARDTQPRSGGSRRRA